jgi:hypothetical protein
MNPHAIDTKPASGPKRRRAAGRNRRSPHPTPQGPPKRAQDPCQGVSAHNPHAYSQTMRTLRAFIGLLIALLLISVAHAVKDGLTSGFALELTLTTLLLLAALGLWRIGSRRKPDTTTRPGTERCTGGGPSAI